MTTILIGCGVVGAGLDVLLHVLQLLKHPRRKTLQANAAWITLASVTLIGLSLFAQFNAGTLVLTVFIMGLALASLITGRDLDGH